MAKRLGHNVRILEQYPSSMREGLAAGISIGACAQEWFQKHDRCSKPYFVKASRVSVRNSNYEEIHTRSIHFQMASWSTLYYRLRANFDGLKSDFEPEPPQPLPTDGAGFYDVGKKVRYASYRGSCITLEVEDALDGSSSTVHADMVIAADGANSTFRRLLCPEVKRKYAGYLTWRASIPEMALQRETVEAFEDQSILYHVPRNYVVAYLIPGENGSVALGSRHLNFVWYAYCAADSEKFTEIMTDTDGRTYAYTLPPGKMRPEVWEKQKQIVEQIFHPIFHDVLANVDRPFVTAVTDYCVPKASFFDDKLVLVGDALSLFRPHNAQSTAQAAFHCNLLEQVLRGEMTMQEWERLALSHADVTGSASKRIGAAYL
ncbi:MAG: hypothetical protein Q9227_008266 [Pyrenula ochraceoflavens]